MMLPKPEPSSPPPESPADAEGGKGEDEKKKLQPFSMATPEAAGAVVSSSSSSAPNPTSTPADAEDVTSTDRIKIEIDEQFRARKLKRLRASGLALSPSASASTAATDVVDKSPRVPSRESQGHAPALPQEPDRRAGRSELSREGSQVLARQDSPPHRRSRARPSALGVSRRVKAETTAALQRKSTTDGGEPVPDALYAAVSKRKKALPDISSPATLREALMGLDLRQEDKPRPSTSSWNFSDPRRTTASLEKQQPVHATVPLPKKAPSRRLLTTSLPAPPAAYQARKQVAHKQSELASAQQPALLLQPRANKPLVSSEFSKAKQSPTNGSANVAPRRRLQQPTGPSALAVGIGQGDDHDSVMNKPLPEKGGRDIDPARPEQSTPWSSDAPYPLAVPLNSELFRLRVPILREVLKQFFTRQWSRQHGYNGGQGTASTPPSSSSHTPASTTSSRMTRCSSSTSSNPPPKRKFSSGGNEDEEPSDDEDSTRGKKVRGNPSSSPQALWACPFSKWKPLTYQACYAYTLKDISRVKQHLRRRHRIPLHCPICTMQFPSEAARDDHLRQRSCREEERSLSQPIEGVTQAQQELLERRVDKSKTKEEQWYSIWDILFPGHSPRPASPHVDYGVSTQLRSFQEFLAADGLAIVNEIARERIPASLAPQQDEVLAFSRTLFEHAIPSLLQRFQDAAPRTNGQGASEASSGRNAAMAAASTHELSDPADEDNGEPSPNGENTQGDLHHDKDHRRSVSGCPSVAHESTISTNSPPTDWTPENDSLWDEFLAYVPDMMTPQTFGDATTFDGYPSQGYGIPNWEPDPVGYLDPLGTFK